MVRGRVTEGSFVSAVAPGGPGPDCKPRLITGILRELPPDDESPLVETAAGLVRVDRSTIRPAGKARR
jgi:hypothetical protein